MADAKIEPGPDASPDAAAAADEPAAARADRPVVKLRPKRGGRFFAGSPWVYADELAMDRRAKALAPGAIATLVDADRVAVATVAVNPGATIAARALDADPSAEIDAAWIAARLSRALGLRERLYDQPVYRLAHAEADGLPGLIVDRYGDAVAVQPNAAWTETRRTAILAALDEVLSPAAVVWSGASRGRRLEGLPHQVRLMKGALDGPVQVRLNGAVYLCDLVGGQKTGFFLDQRDTHAFVARLARGGAMLDVFSHVGGFSLAALAAGARHAVAVDGSEAALSLAREGAAAGGVADRFETRRGDAFDVMRALAEEGARYDVVVCDPPAFAPGKSAREAGLRAYEKTARLGTTLTAAGGIFVLCSCSHAVAPQDLEAAAAAAFRRARRRARLLRSGGAGPDHPAHAHLPETRYLKTLVYALD